MTLEQWLSALYAAENRGQLPQAQTDFASALEKNATLKAAAHLKLMELQELYTARGDLACAFSAKYRQYLLGVLEP